MPSDLVLGFDTSGPWIAAALIRGDVPLSLLHEDRASGQAERLMPTLAAMLAGAGVGWSDLAALGVGTGPGNFTGVRLAVAAARGLALGLGIPALGVDAFDAAALGKPPGPVLVPALRGQAWRRLPGEAPVLVEAPLVLPRPAVPLPLAIARLAQARCRAPAPRPAPLYLREADAAPPSEAPPALIG